MYTTPYYPTLVLLIVTLLLSPTLTLKQSEIHRNDWHKEHLGQIQHLQLIQNKLFYLTKSTPIFGHIKLQNGLIESRISLGTNDRILTVEQREVNILTQNNQLLYYKKHNLQRQANNKLIGDKILKPLKSYIQIETAQSNQNAYLVNDDKNVRVYHNNKDNSVHSQQQPQQQQQFEDIYTAQPQEIIQKVFKLNNNYYVAILNVNEQKFVFRQILVKDNTFKIDTVSKEKLLDWQLEEGDDIQNWALVQTVTVEGNNLVVLMRNKLDQNKAQTIVLSKQFIRNYIAHQAYTQIIHNQLLFSSGKIYNIPKQSQTQRIKIHLDQSINVEFFLEQNEGQLLIFKGQMKYATFEKQSKHQSVSSVYFMEQSTTGGFVLIVQFNDLTLSAYQVQNGIAKLMWTREEGLTAIEKVLFMKYTFNDHLDNEYHRNLLSPAYLEMSLAQKLMKAPTFMAQRVKEEISDLVEIVSSSLASLLDISKLSQMDIKSLAKFTMSEQQQIKLGLKKYIIAVTTQGVIYAIDTKTQQILWKRHHGSIGKSRQIIELMDLRKDYQLEAAVLITYSKEDKTLYLQEINENGDILLLEKIQQCEEKPSIHKLNHESIVINMGEKTVKYRLGESHAHEKHFYFYTEEESRIVGWRQIQNDVVQIWNFNLDQGERIVSTASAYRGEQSTHIPLFDNGKVIFKNVDYTNLAVLTSKNATSMSLYILNGMTGQVLFNEYRSGLNLNHPVNLAYDENNVIVTYYNNRNKLFEIWTVEQYQERIQSSAVNMIKDYLEDATYKPSRNRENIIFLSEVYGSPVTIKKLFISESKESLIRRNLFIITRDDKVYMIGRELVSTRRPKETALFSNEAYPPYQYMLPFDATKFFSYNLDLLNLRSIEFSASDMESTIFIMGYGTDIFLIRVAPDQPFDMITEDFNYLVLVGIMIAVTIGVLILRHKARKAKLIKPHRD